MFKSLTLAGFAVLASLSFAQAATPAAMPAPKSPVAAVAPKAERKPHNGPCKAVIEACKSAGYIAGGHKTGKGIMGDCVKPLSEGKTVSGVTVDPAKLDACKTAHAERKAKYDAKMKSDPAFAKKMNDRKTAMATKQAAKEKGIANKAMEKLAAPAAPADAAK